MIIKFYCVACATGIVLAPCPAQCSPIHCCYYFVKHTTEQLLQPSTNSFFFHAVSSTFTFPSDASFQNLYLKNKRYHDKKTFAEYLLTRFWYDCSCPIACQRFVLYCLHFSARLSFGFVIPFFKDRLKNVRSKIINKSIIDK